MKMGWNDEPILWKLGKPKCPWNKTGRISFQCEIFLTIQASSASLILFLEMFKYNVLNWFLWWILFTILIKLVLPVFGILLYMTTMSSSGLPLWKEEQTKALWWKMAYWAYLDATQLNGTYNASYFIELLWIQRYLYHKLTFHVRGTVDTFKHQSVCFIFTQFTWVLFWDDTSLF